MSKNMHYSTILLLMFVIFYGLIQNIFTMSGWKFALEFIILIGLLLFGLMATVLIYNRLTFGFVLSSFVSGIALLNLVAIYFRGGMTTLLFLSIVSAITAFVVSIVNISGTRRGPKKVPKVEIVHAPMKKPAKKKTVKKKASKKTKKKTSKKKAKRKAKKK